MWVWEITNLQTKDIRIITDTGRKFFYLKKICVPQLATCMFLFFHNEPELGVGIDPGMALTHLALDREQTHNHLIVSRVLYR